MLIISPSSDTATPSRKSAKIHRSRPPQSPQRQSSSGESAYPTTPRSATQSRTPPAAQSQAESSTPPSPDRPARQRSFSSRRLSRPHYYTTSHPSLSPERDNCSPNPPL